MPAKRTTRAKTARAKTTSTSHGSSHGSLDEYRRKRDFAKTSEPSGGKAPHSSKLRFVIQKHDATNLHFDLRLELDGVMKSWAVPKGPSLDPAVKRLAMQVEDHPIEYNTFEGKIPEGEYGGGTVMLWDRGTYGPVPTPSAPPDATKRARDRSDPSDESMLRQSYEKGDFKFELYGERLRGSWVLVRTRYGSSSKEQWLLIKHRDDYAVPGSDIVAEEVTSVATGRTMDEIAANGTGHQHG